ncbi:Hypothetical protein PBC10988_20750 [Planctomycetales bacterium 10988]|nr:Hypothetical protein PBC10988_20750 [Planctomycetales bacterium 10988]
MYQPFVTRFSLRMLGLGLAFTFVSHLMSTEASAQTPIYSSYTGSPEVSGEIVYEGVVSGDVVYEGDTSYGGVVYEGTPGVVGSPYYAPSSYGYGTGMYPSPHWVPPYTGWTSITYPPFAPHHYLWVHDRVWSNGRRHAVVHYR